MGVCRDHPRNCSIYLCAYIHAHVCCVCDRSTNSEVRRHLHLTTDVLRFDMCCQILLYVGSEFHSQHGKNKTQPYGQAPRQIDLHGSQHTLAPEGWMSYLPKRALNLKKGPIAIGCWGYREEWELTLTRKFCYIRNKSKVWDVHKHLTGMVMSINTHLFCISRLNRRWFRLRMCTKITDAKPQTALKTLEKSASRCGRCFIKIISCSPRNGLSKSILPECMGQESRKRVVSLHWAPCVNKMPLQDVFRKTRYGRNWSHV